MVPALQPWIIFPGEPYEVPVPGPARKLPQETPSRSEVLFPDVPAGVVDILESVCEVRSKADFLH